MKKSQSEGYVAFNSLDAEIILVSDKKEAKKMNDFNLKELKDQPKTTVFSQKTLTNLIGKKIRITIEEL